MRGVIVAVDLETTGLDVSDAQIIEIGAVKFRDDEIIETFTTLVDPGMPLPARITSITGIRQEDLIGAPKLNDVLPRFKEFAGDAIILGHNIDFDLRFLNKAGALKNSPAIDTYEMASVLLPTTPRYNLNALMQELQLQPDGSYHRALADAMATARVYMVLWRQLAHTIPLELIREIVNIAQEFNWRGILPFKEALAIREPNEPTLPPKSIADLFALPVPTTAPLQPAATITPLPASTEGLSAPQRELADAVTTAFNQNQSLLIEVGDGLDAVPGYLRPALAWAQQNGERVLIATPDGELHYHPDSLPAGAQISYLKSRQHYLCPGRLRVLRQRLPTSIEELRVLGKILAALYLFGEEAGDRDHISLRGPGEYAAWARLSAQDEACTLDRCEAQMNGVCPFYKARRTADSAHLVVAEHGLLIADAEADGVVLPPYSRVIIDGAHALEETITAGLRSRIEASTIKTRLADMGTGRRGLLGNVISSLQATIQPKQFEQLNRFIANVAAAITSMDHHVDALFKAIYACLEATDHLSNTEFVVFVRLNKNLRNHSAFGPVREAFSVLSEFTDTITAALERLSSQLVTLRGRYVIADLEDLIAGTDAAAQYLKTLQSDLQACFIAPHENTAYWFEFARDNFRLSILAAPIQVGKMIQQYLWSAKQTTILISPTLRVTNSFEYVRERFTAPRDQVGEVLITNQHDYQQSTLLLLPTDMPEPTERERYQRSLERTIIELATATNGRLLGLFTSFTQLRQSAQNIAARLSLGNITVFDQSDGTTQQSLMEGFRSTERAVLLGSRSFWDEAQFSADELITTVITRLPFAVPTDPLVATRGETFDNSFNEFMVPDAILKLRQGFGRRMVGTAGQRGVVVILDKRMISKEYGKQFLESLPSCTVVKVPLADLTGEIKKWLEG